MHFLPFDKFTLETKKSKTELSNLLSEQIEPKKHFRIKHYFADKEIKPYEGKIENNSFKINRIIRYQNPFSPIIKGEFETISNGGSNIKIVARIRYAVLFLMIFWCSAPLMFFLFFQNKSNNEIKYGVIISSALFIIAIGFAYLGFNKERNKSKLFLKRLFQAE